MEKSVRIIVMDTETVGTRKKHLLDIGYYLIELKGKDRKILKTFNYLIDTVIDNNYFMENDKFIDNEKYKQYLAMLKKGEIKKISLKKCFKLINKDIKNFKVKYLYAYNSKFDSAVFKADSEYNKLINPLEGVKVIDLYALACNCLINSKDYYNWAIKNNQITDSGNYIKSSVETLIRYLNNDLNFIEKHTALSDSRCELQILYKMLDIGKNIFDTTDKIKLVKIDCIKSQRVKINGNIYILKYDKIINRKNLKIYSNSSLSKE